MIRRYHLNLKVKFYRVGWSADNSRTHNLRKMHVVEMRILRWMCGHIRLVSNCRSISSSGHMLFIVFQLSHYFPY